MNLIGRRPHGSLKEFLKLTTAASCLIVITKGLLLYNSARAEEMTDNEIFLTLPARPLFCIFSPVLQQKY